MKMVEKKGFVARVAPPRPEEEGTPLVVGSEEAPAFPGLEFEAQEPITVDTPAPIGEDGILQGGFIVGSTITFDGVDQPIHQPTAVAHDDHAHLPDHVREEILAGRKAITATEAKHSLEMSLGAKLSTQNHARTRPKTEAWKEGDNLEAPKVPVAPDMYGTADTRFGKGNITEKVTRKGNYNEGSED